MLYENTLKQRGHVTTDTRIAGNTVKPTGMGQKKLKLCKKTEINLRKKGSFYFMLAGLKMNSNETEL